MDWKKNKYYFRDSTAYSTWATSDTYGATTVASDNYIHYGGAGTTAYSAVDWGNVTTYMAKVDLMHENMITFISGGTFVNGITIGNSKALYGNFIPIEETPEEKAAREERDLKYAEEVRRADHKARSLFLKIAGKHRYRLLKRNSHFDIVGKSGQRYRLAIGEKVQVMKGCFGDEVLHKLCAYVPDVPQVDTLLAQYLALTSGTEGEKEFEKIAIKHAA